MNGTRTKGSALGLGILAKPAAAAWVELLGRGYEEAHAEGIGDDVATIFQTADVIFLLDDEAARAPVGDHVPLGPSRFVHDALDTRDLR